MRTGGHLRGGHAGGGHWPEETFRCGESYGSTAHKLLLDPTINRARQLTLSNRTTDDFTVEPARHAPPGGRPTDAIYFDPMIPGYEGFTPNLNAKNGQRYRVLAREGLTEFQLQEKRNKASLNKLERKIELQAGKWEARSIKDRLLLSSHSKFPVPLVRPDCAATTYGGNRVTAEEQYEDPRDHSPLPHFMDIYQSGQHLMSGGYTGHVPYGLGRFGETNAVRRAGGLEDFTRNDRQRRSVEWAPIIISRPDPPSVLLARLTINTLA